jgi:hypothetical protein
LEQQTPDLSYDESFDDVNVMVASNTTSMIGAYPGKLKTIPEAQSNAEYSY